MGSLVQLLLNLIQTVLDRERFRTTDGYFDTLAGRFVFIQRAFFKGGGENSVSCEHLIAAVLFVVCSKTGIKLVPTGRFKRQLQASHTTVFIPVEQLIVFQNLKLIIDHLGGHRTGQAALQAFCCSGNTTLGLDAAVHAFGGGHDGQQQHSDLENTEGVLVALHQMAALLKVTDEFSGFGILVAEIAFTGEEIIPQPFRRQPLGLIEGTIGVDIADETLIRHRLILHKPEKGTLRRRIAFCHAGQQLDGHRMHRAQQFDGFGNLVIQPGHVRQEGLDFLHDRLAFFLPMLIHARARTKGAGDQIIGSVGADMEFRRMEAVGDHLIAVFAHAVDHLVGAVHNIEHEEGLHFAELGDLLHHSMVI